MSRTPGRAASLGIVCWWLLASLAAAPRPNPSLAPGEVIRAVVEALQHCNSPAPNAGIFTVYHFASPANRVITGPYGTFLRLLKSPDFAPLFTGRVIGYGPISVAPDRAEQAVSFLKHSGQVVWFRFVVSRQTSEQTQGQCTGCWMVDEVSPASPTL